MKKNKYFLIIFVLLLCIIPVTATIQITDFTKIQTFNATNYMTLTTQQGIVHDSVNHVFIISGKRYNDSTLAYINTVVNLTNGYIDGAYYYGLLTNSERVYKYYALNGSYVSGVTTSASTDTSYTFLNNKQLGMTTGNYVFITQGDFVSTHKALLSDFCRISGHSIYVSIIGYDTIQDYAMVYYNNQYWIYDGHCGVVYTGTPHLNGNRTLPGLQNMIYDNSDYVFYAEDHLNNTFVSFDNSAYEVDNYNFKSVLNYTNFSFGGRDYQNCDYDSNNKIYACLGYRNNNEYNVTLLLIDVDNGDFGNVSEYRESYFNNPGFDVYRISTTYHPLLFFYDNHLYMQMYDSVTGVYELWRSTPTVINSYTGLTCNNDNSFCVDSDKVCFPNNELYPGVNSSNYVCEKVGGIYGYDNSITCDIDNVTYCSGGCVNKELINPYNIHYESGTCYNSSLCIDECNIEGYTISDTSTSYKECGFYDSDPCLDWSNSIPCIGGEFSVGGFCKALNTSGYTYYNLNSFTIIPDIRKSIDYSFTSNPMYVNLVDQYTFITEGFSYTSGVTSFYINLNCDYKETLLYSDATTQTINTSLEQVFSGYTNGVSTINFKPVINGSVLILGKDLGGTTIFSYTVEDNSTYGTCLYDNDSLLGCDSSLLSEYSNIDLSIQTIKPNTDYLSSVRLTINLKNGGKSHIYTGLSSPVNSPTTTYYKLVISSNNATYNSLKVINGEQYLNTWKNTSSGVVYDVNMKPTYVNSCYYTTLGCYTTRSYYTRELSNGLWNYKDVKICVNTLGSSTLVTTGNNVFDNMTPRAKLFTALISSILVFFLVLLIGLIYGNVVIFGWIGTFMSVGLVGYFAIIGWLPTWLIIVMLLISAFVVMMFFRKTVVGRDEA